MNEINNFLNGVKVEWKKLGEVCEIVTDYVAAGSFKTIADNVKYLNKPDYAQLIRTKDIKSKFQNSDTFVYVDKKAFNFLYRVNLNTECLILPNIGNCGEIYYIKPEILPYKNNVLGPNAIFVKSKSENNRFLYYLFLSIYFQKELYKITSKTGQGKFNKTELKEILIPIPPLEIQEKIAKTLDKFTNYATELQTELQLRTKQYEYYRNLLLSREFLENMCVKFDDKPCGGRLETKMLGELLDYEQPTKYIVKDTNYDDEFSIPVLTAGQTFILGYTDEKENIYKSNEKNPVIIFDDFTTANKWVNFNFKVKSSAMKILKPKDESVNLRYCYFYMQTLNVDITEHKRMWISEYSKQEILYPPIKVQNEVVRILDKFSEISSNLEKGLPKEIDLRQKEYEFYRDRLLNFKKD